MLEYPLLVTTFSSEDCRGILQPALEVGLPTSGICQNMNRAIVHAPLCFQGLGIPSLYVSQGISHIEALLNEPPLEAGSLLIFSAEDLKLEVGLPGHLLQQDYKRFQRAITPCWWMSTWEFAHIGQIWLEDNLLDLPLQRIHDQYITNIFLKAGSTGKFLGRSNQCRIFLQAVSLSDITTGDRLQITEKAWHREIDTGCPTYF